MASNDAQVDFSSCSKGLDSGFTLHLKVASGTKKEYTAATSPRAIRADAAGVVEVKDSAGTTAAYNCIQGEILHLRSITELTTNTAVAVQLLW